MMEEARGMEYEERLRQTSLVTLEARRTRADIIEVFKIMKGLEGLKREDFFEMEVEKRTRGHTLKIDKKGARLDCRRYSFSQRVVNNWNALPGSWTHRPTVLSAPVSVDASPHRTYSPIKIGFTAPSRIRPIGLTAPPRIRHIFAAFFKPA